MQSHFSARLSGNLQNLIGQSRQGAAVLLYGAPDAGQDLAAAYLAQAWVCTSDQQKPCNDCPSCRAFAGQRHVDVNLVAPWGSGNSIKLSSIRHDAATKDPFKGIPVIEFLRTRPLMSSTKVVWFQNCERFEARVANAILKTLEELPPYARIVMSTSAIAEVIPTIRSRTLLIPVAVDPMESWGINLSAEPLAARFARTPIQANFVLEHKQIFGRLDTLLSLVISGGREQGLRLAEEFRELCDAYAKQVSKDKRTAQLELLDFAATWVSANPHPVPSWIRAISAAHRHIQGNGSARIATDALFITGSSQDRELLDSIIA